MALRCERFSVIPKIVLVIDFLNHQRRTYVCSLMLLSAQAWHVMFDFVQDRLPL